MGIINYSKLEVATQQLDTALRLYFQKKEYFSAITLAGAAEEIFGVYLKIHNQTNAFDNHLKSSLNVYHWLHETEGSRDQMHKTINRIKTASKHMQGKHDTSIVCDAREEAKDILDRAISHYYTLMQFEDLEETPKIAKFSAHLVSKNV